MNRFPSRSLGFTLIELMVTLAVASTALTIGIPSYQYLTASNSITSEINLMVAHMQLAKSVAIKSGQHIVMCPSQDSSSCSTQPDWSRGYILFKDSNNNRTKDEDEPVLRIYTTQTKNTLLIRSSVNRNKIVFQPTGFTPGTNLTISFCSRENVVTPKGIRVSNTGRALISDQTWRGTPIPCPNA